MTATKYSVMIKIYTECWCSSKALINFLVVLLNKCLCIVFDFVSRLLKETIPQNKPTKRDFSLPITHLIPCWYWVTFCETIYFYNPAAIQRVEIIVGSAFWLSSFLSQALHLILIRFPNKERGSAAFYFESSAFCFHMPHQTQFLAFFL